MSEKPKKTRVQKCAAQHFGVWAIEPKWFAQAISAVKAGTFKAAAPGPDQPNQKGYTTTGGVAVIQICGQMTKAKSSFGGASSIDTRKALRNAVQDPEVRAIMLQIDSPGGTVAGTADLANDIDDADAKKPVYAQIDDMGCSAAYWIASQARRVSANSTAMVGSIGTLMVLDDTSGMYEKAGVKVHVISTGKFKGAGVDGSKVTDEQLAAFQEEVDNLNEVFLTAVATGRKLTMAKVEELADGRVHVAQQAKDLGLIDAVASADDTMKYIQQEIYRMANPIETFKAEHPDAYKAIKQDGYNEAKAELTPKPATVAEMKAAFPDDAGFVVDQLGANATLAQAKAAYADVLAEKHKTAMAAKDAEIERLGKVANMVTSGAAGVNTEAPKEQSAASAKPTEEDPKALAEWEWDNKADTTKGYSTKERYVAIRSREISGEFRAQGDTKIKKT